MHVYFWSCDSPSVRPKCRKQTRTNQKRHTHIKKILKLYISFAKEPINYAFLRLCCLSPCDPQAVRKKIYQKGDVCVGLSLSLYIKINMYINTYNYIRVMSKGVVCVGHVKNRRMCGSLSLSLSLSLSVYIYTHIYELSIYIYIYMRSCHEETYLWVSLSLSLSLSINIYAFCQKETYVWVSLSLSFAPSLPLSLFLSLSPSLYFYINIYELCQTETYVRVSFKERVRVC